jgi:hypothetical protein
VKIFQILENKLINVKLSGNWGDLSHRMSVAENALKMNPLMSPLDLGFTKKIDAIVFFRSMGWTDERLTIHLKNLGYPPERIQRLLQPAEPVYARQPMHIPVPSISAVEQLSQPDYISQSASTHTNIREKLRNFYAVDPLGSQPIWSATILDSDGEFERFIGNSPLPEIVSAFDGDGVDWNDVRVKDERWFIGKIKSKQVPADEMEDLIRPDSREQYLIDHARE